MPERPKVETPADILSGLADLYRQRNAVYKDNWKHVGPVMAGFYPDGVTLNTPEDFIRFHLFMLMIIKLTRYTNNWSAGHSDSLRDTAVYSAMLDAADAEIHALGGRAHPHEVCDGCDKRKHAPNGECPGYNPAG